MKTTKVYRGPGYPVDPKLEERRHWDRCIANLENLRFDYPDPLGEQMDKLISQLLAGNARPSAPFERQELATVDHVDNALRIPREGRREFQRELGQAWVQGGKLLSPNMSRK